MDLLRHLNYFVAVAEELHFGRAATRLHMAQPPLSQRIRGLEQHLKVSLFDRSSRRVELTPAGRLLLPEARELLARADRVSGLAERMRTDEPAELRVAATPALAAPVLAAAIASFRELRPDVRLEMREVADERQLDELAAGSLDLGLVRQPAETGRLVTGRLLSTPLGVIAAGSSELAAAPEVELAALAGFELVLFDRSDARSVYDELLAECRAHGFAPAEVRAAQGVQFAAGLVLAGRSVMLSPRHDPPAGCSWRPLAGEPLRFTASTVWRPDVRNDALEAFDAALTDAMLSVGGWRDAASTIATANVAPAHGLLA